MNPSEWLELHPEPSVNEVGAATYHEWHSAFNHAIKTGEDILGAEKINMIPDYTVYMHHSSSQGARLLTKALGIRTLTPKTIRMKFAYRDEETTPKFSAKLINWGAATPFDTGPHNLTWINKPEQVKAARSRDYLAKKLIACNVPIPETTTKLSEALTWMRQGKDIIVYTKAGPVFADSFSDFANAQSWSLYKKKTNEFRCHVVKDEIIYIQDKVPRKYDHTGEEIDPTRLNRRIRSRENGYTFTKSTYGEIPHRVLESAHKAIRAVGLDFGAVDIIWNKVTKQAFVLDTTATPLMTKDIATAYAEKIKEYY